MKSQQLLRLSDNVEDLRDPSYLEALKQAVISKLREKYPRMRPRTDPGVGQLGIDGPPATPYSDDDLGGIFPPPLPGDRP